jgi:hypothetical protein
MVIKMEIEGDHTLLRRARAGALNLALYAGALTSCTLMASALMSQNQMSSNIT